MTTEELKSPGRSLTSSAATYLGANVLNAAIPFALLPVLTRYMEPAEYGQVAMYQTLLTALSAINGINAHGAAGIKYYDVAITRSELAHFIGASLQILCFTTSVLACAFLLLQDKLSTWLGLPPRFVFWAVVASSSSFIIQLRLSQWQVRSEAFKYGLLQVLQSLCNAGLSLLLVVGLARGAAGRIEAQNWVLLAFALLAVFLLVRDKLIELSWRPLYIREALSFGAPLVPHFAGIFLLGTVDRLVINRQLGLGEVGIYMVAVQLSLVLPIVFSAINNAYVPWLFERLRRNDEAEKRQIVRGTYLYFLVVLSLALMAFAIGPLLVPLLAGERYRGAGDLVGWLTLGQVFGGMYLMVTNYAFFAKRTGLLSLATISSGLVNLALLLVMTRTFGLQGAAAAFAVTMALRFGLSWWVARRSHTMPWFDFHHPVAVKGEF